MGAQNHFTLSIKAIRQAICKVFVLSIRREDTAPEELLCYRIHTVCKHSDLLNTQNTTEDNRKGSASKAIAKVNPSVGPGWYLWVVILVFLIYTQINHYTQT